MTMTTRISTIRSAGLRVKSRIKGGKLSSNHNAGNVGKVGKVGKVGLKVKTAIKAGRIAANHSAGLKVHRAI